MREDNGYRGGVGTHDWLFAPLIAFIPTPLELGIRWGAMIFWSEVTQFPEYPGAWTRSPCAKLMRDLCSVEMLIPEHVGFVVEDEPLHRY